MKVRLRHGAVAKQEKPSHASGYGLPTTILNKVLRAADLPRPGMLTTLPQHKGKSKCYKRDR